MSDMNDKKYIRDELAKDLLGNFEDFQEIKEKGGSTAANKVVAEGLADSIVKALDGVGGLRFKGDAAPMELNDLVEVSQGDIYILTESGTLINGKDGNPMDVSMGDVVIWDGEHWAKFMGMDVAGFVTEADLEKEATERKFADNNLSSAILNEAESRASSDEALADAINTHAASMNNPHGVTAEQVGAYTKEQVDGFIRNWSGYVVVPFGQQKPAASEAQLGKIYLVQVSDDPHVRDQYEEWISDGTTWSRIGMMEIDLSQYDKIVDAKAREKAISDALSTHEADTVKHITEAERTKWNDAAEAVAEINNWDIHVADEKMTIWLK